MTTDGLLTFASRAPDRPPVEIRVNFGIFAGRESTSAELDDLAQALVRNVGEVSIISEQRREVGQHSQAALHQIRIEVAKENLPEGEAEIERLIGRLLEVTERWAEACIAERHADLAEA